MPNTGDRTRDSILWVPGESTGRDYTGATVAVPAKGSEPVCLFTVIDAIFGGLLPVI